MKKAYSKITKIVFLEMLYIRIEFCLHHCKAALKQCIKRYINKGKKVYIK